MGVHCSNSFHASGKALKEARFARSRVGSGSHIMTYVLAEQNGWEVNDHNFVTVGNIDGAVEAFENDTADVLLWEKFMTAPLVEAGKMKKNGDLISPWPCFVLVASERMLEDERQIAHVSDTIIEVCNALMKRSSTISEISEFYDLSENSVAKWYSTVEWQTSDWISKKMLENVIATLRRVDLVEKNLRPEDVCFSKAKLY